MSPNRFPVIDSLRTLALALMITYHLIYDLDQWTNLAVDVNNPLWFIIGKTAALLFIFLSGLSSGLSKHPLKNGLRVLFFGMIITLVTYVAFPGEYIRFGILHFLGVMMALYPLIRKLPNGVLLLCSVLAIGIGFIIKNQVVNTPLLLPLGFIYPDFSTLDFYPLFPYSGVTFLGVLCYRYFFANQQVTKASAALEKKKLKNKKNHNSFPQKKRAAYPMFTWISRHSLWIYLIHQPILVGLIFTLKNFAFIS
ncbi:heparan-alpha-glucosaminide N-acetyltransferase [Desulfitobacterium sp. PCE1]|uniref:heparan-alpha-glucosaminide N-acetyltransferase n=1 Tax=Desulfitobacterium sp. PCE1 TaxID=146907 RepID=UPI00035EB5E4|nr:heparan-alpha-glucosaminide N-acetyltransferase [Desulfitobacterium sp. PCE1]